MKVLYISGPSFLDMDLSFVGAMGRVADCHFLLDVYPKLRNATALNMEQMSGDCGIRPMDSFSSLRHFGEILDIRKCHLIVRSHNYPLAPSNLMLQWKLLRFILKLQPDIIHFNNQIYFTHFYLFLLPIVKLISIHDPFPHSGEEAAALRFSHRLYELVNSKLIHYHLLYNDLMVKQYADSRNIKQERVITSALGPYEYLQQYQTSDSSKIDFLFFGRIQKYKGLDDLLEAFAELIKSHPKATLTIAGSGALWFDIAKYNIPSHNLTLLNRFIPPEELADLLHRCRVVICPYKDATQSGVVMSAYALKRTVIVTNVGALPSVVEDGLTGWIVPPASPAKLAVVMDQAILTDEATFEAMGCRIEEVYLHGDKSWSAIAGRLFKKYRIILDQE